MLLRHKDKFTICNKSRDTTLDKRPPQYPTFYHSKNSTMLSIFILAGIATTFARTAFGKDRSRFVWGFIGVASYFLMQVVAGIVIRFINPDWLTNQGILIGVSLLSGFIGVGIAYYILYNLSDPIEETDADLLDS
ncbi:MAG: hypothetical protein JNL70_14955 [Saprospiraceae bacterium]|nr:hypothetical protein [Saprospiraceae bacterium]